jgi:hypothetical protein
MRFRQTSSKAAEGDGIEVIAERFGLPRLDQRFRRAVAEGSDRL